MILVGIDIGKNKHTFSIIDKGTGEILLSPSAFDNNQTGFLYLTQKLSNYVKSELLIGMEDSGHFAFLRYFHFSRIRRHLQLPKIISGN